MARQASHTSGIIFFTKDKTRNSVSAVGLPQLYFDQLRAMNAHIAQTILAVVHKAITGPKFNRRSFKKQLDWNEWRDSEWVQLDNYARQGMFGPPCTAPVDASIFFWVWLYSIKPHKNNRNKVHGICDGSTRGGHKMVHGSTYAPPPPANRFSPPSGSQHGAWTVPLACECLERLYRSQPTKVDALYAL
jgi:hypothetical protein